VNVYSPTGVAFNGTVNVILRSGNPAAGPPLQQGSGVTQNLAIVVQNGYGAATADLYSNPGDVWYVEIVNIINNSAAGNYRFFIADQNLMVIRFPAVQTVQTLNATTNTGAPFIITDQNIWSDIWNRIGPNQTYPAGQDALTDIDYFVQQLAFGWKEIISYMLTQGGINSTTINPIFLTKYSALLKSTSNAVTQAYLSDPTLWYRYNPLINNGLQGGNVYGNFIGELFNDIHILQSRFDADQGLQVILAGALGGNFFN